MTAIPVLDGLAGSVGLVALGGLMVVASAGGLPGAALVAAFLMFNLPTQLNRSVRTFMGDAGSTLLGFVLAGLSLTLVQPAKLDLAPAIVLWLMPIPIFELFTSTARRIVRGMPPTQADSGHFHHRLVAAGVSVRAICALYFLVSPGSCIAGVWAWRRGVSEPLLPAWFRRTELASGH